MEILVVLSFPQRLHPKLMSMKLAHGVLLCSLLTSALVSYGQNSVGIGVATPNKNAVLELVSTNNNQGVLVPKLTTAQRTATAFTSALTTKENGLLVFDSSDNKFYYWDTNQWKPVGSGDPQDLQLVGSTLTVTNNPGAVPINLSSLNIPQDLSLTGSTLTITNNPSATPINLGAFTGTNTDDQTLSFNTGTSDLSITRQTGGPQTVNIAAGNTDDQTLAYTGATGVLSITRKTGGPQTVTLTPAGAAGGDLTGTYPSPTVTNNAITSAKILDGAVASADIADGTIATADIAAAAVGDTQLATGIAVSKLSAGTLNQVLTTTAGGTAWQNAPAASGAAGGDLTGTYPNPAVAANAITSAKILDGTVASADITDNSIVSADIFDGTVASVDITDNSVTTTDILDGTIATADIAAAAVTDTQVASGIAVAKLAPGALTQVLTTTAGGTVWAPAPTATGAAGGDLSGTYPSPAVAANAITSAKILDGTVASADITDNSILSADILDNTVASIDIADNTIATADILDATVASIDIATGGVQSVDILDQTIVTADIADNAVTTTQILDNTIGTADIATDGVASSDILDGTIVNADVAGTAAIQVSKLLGGNSGEVLVTSGTTPIWTVPTGFTTLINNAGTRNLFAGNPVGSPSGFTANSDNTFYGWNAGAAGTTGSWNVVMGSQAGQNNIDGTLNVLIGWRAGFATVTAGQFNGNTFIGAQAGQASTGGPNTFIGEKAGQTNTSSTQNVFVGNQTGLNNTTTGGQHTLIGYQANVSTAGMLNSTAIGFQATVNASNKVRLGNTSVTVIEGQVGFTAASDRRLKDNITPIASGLDLIMKLKPVSYNMKNSTDSRLNWGFIAQDIEALVGDKNAVLTVGGDKDRTLGLRYQDFVAPLVKAVQEQQDQISSLNSKLNESEKKYEALAAELEQIKKAIGLKAEIKK